MAPIRYRKRKHLGGKVIANPGKKGVSSFTVKPVKGVTYNTRSKKWTVKMGPFKWESK